MAAATIIGLGGLGCPAAVSLAEGGVERLVLVDDDTVERSNLQRQVLYTTADLGRPKIDVAAERLRQRFPATQIITRSARLTAATIADLCGDADVIVDATDDPPARFVLNDWALAHGVGAVLGGVLRFQGLVMAVAPGHGPCYRCLFEEPPGPGEAATCGEAGVLGALCGVVGHLQARRALALLAGDVAGATGYVTTIDGLRGRIRDVRVPDVPDCPACGVTRARPPIPESGARTASALPFVLS